MAFESIVAYIILFSVGMSAVVGLAMYYKDYVLKTTTTLDDRQKILEQKEKSDIEILGAKFDQPSTAANIKTIITSENDFHQGILEQTNETAQAGNLTLDLNGANYFDSGNWTSPIYDLGNPINFSKFFMSLDIPASTWLGLQIRTAVNTSELTGDFIGPDGTTSSYYFYMLSGAGINNLHDGDQVIQLKIFLNTTDITKTPALEELNITYSWVYGLVNITLKNNGKIRLNKDILDIFVDDTRFSRSYNNLSIELIPETDTTNPGLWDPEEEIKILFPYNLSTGKHIVKITTEFSTYDYITFTT